MLSQAIARDREVAIRASLGATRARIVRQLLLESVLLSLAGGVVGGVTALLGVRMIHRLIPVQLPEWMTIAVEWQAAVFLGVIALGTGVLAGLLPAWRSGSPDLQAALREGARGSSTGIGQQRLRNALVVVEVAFALVLLVGAGLLVQTIWRLQQVNPGFDMSRALTFRVELGWAAYGTRDQTTAFHQEVLARLRDLPTVQAVTFDTNLPMSGKPRDPLAVRTPGQGRDDEARNPYVHVHLVGPEYFETMGIGVLVGRGFDSRDQPDGLPVAIVSARLAERLWPGRDAVGQRLQLEGTADPDNWLTVVGVSVPVRQHELDGAPGFDLYRSYLQVNTADPPT